MDYNRKTALYVRVSTDSQFEEGYSVEAQTEKLEAWCKVKNYKNTELYVDGGWSGSNIDRPELRRLMGDIAMGKVAVVVVYKLDRLSRSQKDTLFLLEDVFAPNDCDFISINENFDTTSPYGKAMIGILSVFAQLERENIKERTRMGMYSRVKSGLWMGGDGIPFGYDYDKELGYLVPNRHAEDVRNIFDLYLKGYSTTKLAQMFDVSSDKQITDILDRITYLGKISYRGEVFEGKHEALIDQETFDKVQRERSRRSTKNTVTSSYLLTGLLVCGKCGAKMRYQKWTSGTTKIVCYSTQASSKPNLVKDPNCDSLRHNSELIEQVVVEDLMRMTEKKQVKPKKLMPETSNLEMIQRRYDLAMAKLKRLLNLYAEDSSEFYLDSIEEAKNSLQSVAAQLEREKATMAVTKDIDDQNELLANLRGNWPSMTMPEKQRVLRLCISSITIFDDSIDVHYNL